MTRVSDIFTAAFAALMACLVLASAANAQEPTPTLDGVGIVGDPVVGSTLQAVPVGTVDPSTVAFSWCHQGERVGKCVKGGPLASGPVYVPVESDIGYALLVKASATILTFEVEVVSAPTAPVLAEPASTDPTPTDPPPEPNPTDPATDPPTTDPVGAAAPPPTYTSSGTTPVAAGQEPPVAVLPAPPSFLRPFPVVRIRGTVAARGSYITLLRVTASRRARVDVRCAGRGCPIRHRSRAAGRIRSLERYLRAGTRITIRVRRPGYIGKYVRLRIRGGEPPARRDACLMPASSRPVECPSA
jgi:hypothetical protein